MQTQSAVFETPLLAAHRAASARLGEFSGCLLPDGFSDFDTEYQISRNKVALFDTNWHLSTYFTGRDRVKYLHAITSADVKDLATGQGMLGVLLNPQGRILAELEIYALAESILVRSHVSLRNQTLGTLKKYILGSQVKLDDATDKIASFAIEGPHATEVIEEFCGVQLDELCEMGTREIAIDGATCRIIRRSHFGSRGAEFLAPRGSLESLWQKALTTVQSHRGAPIGMLALNSLRLEADIPWFPADFNDTVIPHEAALESTHISWDKGCYTGQEIVERVRSQGRVNKKRVRLKFSSPDPPLPGTKLRAAGNEVGTVTSAAYSPASHTAIGTGYARREHNTPGSALEYDGGSAEVIE